MATDAVATPPTVEELRAKTREYSRAVSAAERKLVEIKGDPDSTIEALAAALHELEAAQAALAKHERAIETAELEANKGIRDEAVAAFREMLKGNEHLKTMFSAGITFVSITPGENGSDPLVDARTKAVSRGGAGGGGSRGSITWTYQGNTYTSRQLLETFGDQFMGEGWWAKMDPKQNPAKATAGFNQPLHSLAKKMGAVGTRPDGSTVELG